MPIINIQRIPGLPKQQEIFAAGVRLCEALDGLDFSGDAKISINGKYIGPDDEIGFTLTASDIVNIYDQPQDGGLVKTLLNPLEHLNPIKFTQKVMSSLYNTNANATNTAQTKTSPNNNLKSQTNIARNGEARPDNFGQVRAFPDLLQESLTEYIDNVKYVTELMNFGLGRYDVSSIRYAESSLDALQGATSQVFQPGEVISQLYEPYYFDDVSGEEVNPKNDDGSTIITGPYFSPTDGDELWINTNSALPGNTETNWTVTFWKVDDDNNEIQGTRESRVFRQPTPHDVSQETFYRTDKFYPLAGRGRYAVQLVRNDRADAASKLTLESIGTMTLRQNVVHPNDTTVLIRIKAAEGASAKDRKYNALITRHVITFNRDTQQVDYMLRPSRIFPDIVLHNWIITGKQSIDNIDADMLYQIYDNLPDPRLGYFDYTFDDADISLGERLQRICDAATVTVFCEDGYMSFVRDEPRQYPATVFNTANSMADGYRLTYDMTLNGGFDGVELQYKDPLTNKQSYVYFRITDNDSIEEGEPAKPKKFQLLYIRNRYQAVDRAMKECLRIMFSRKTMSITALSDGEWVNVGDMIQVVDWYDTNQQSGKITGRNGDDFTTSERIEFSGSMFVVITDADGVPTDRIPVHFNGNTSSGFNAPVPNISLNIWNGEDVQSASRYFIATAGEMDETLWTITQKQTSADGKTSITVSEYNQKMYEYEVSE
ncbi:hypothetical protein EDC52_101731 [Biostraticola tofi]|uniref:Phage tail protein n=1 Tax=Biostraticola tofi TaxID=466109 RepID=A0A4R3Z815_9GAMM|nr:host specificity factor TipJ family phage tail protein [Biostraticola tofi]TCW00381.1 hypothetical protein EDC52_101731 [Biostraticola tofi]